MNMWNIAGLTLLLMLMAIAFAGCAHQTANDVYHSAKADWCEIVECDTGKSPWK